MSARPREASSNSSKGWLDEGVPRRKLSPPKSFFFFFEQRPGLHRRSRGRAQTRWGCGAPSTSSPSSRRSCCRSTSLAGPPKRTPHLLSVIHMSTPVGANECLHRDVLGRTLMGKSHMGMFKVPSCMAARAFANQPIISSINKKRGAYSPDHTRADGLAIKKHVSQSSPPRS